MYHREKVIATYTHFHDYSHKHRKEYHQKNWYWSQIAWQRCLWSYSRGGKIFWRFIRSAWIEEVKGLSFRLSGWQQRCARTYERKCGSKICRDMCVFACLSPPTSFEIIASNLVRKIITVSESDSRDRCLISYIVQKIS